MKLRKIKLILCLALLLAPAQRGGAQTGRSLELNNEGVEFLGRGEIETAIARLEAAHRIARENKSITMNLASAYIRQAGELTAKGELSQAVHWLDEATSLSLRDERIKNNIAAGYNDIAAVHSRAGRYAEAISLLTTAVNLMPGSTVLRANLGMALYRDNRRAEALDEFRNLASSEPDNALARKMYGMLLYWKGNTREALEELKAAARLAPSDGEVGELVAKIEREYSVEKEFDVDSHVHFTISFDAKKDYRIGKAVLDALEDAWSRVGSDLNFYPREKVAVVVYTGRQFRELLNKSKNVGGMYDGKIRVPVGGLDAERDKEALKRVLTHEYAHAVIHFLTHNRCPLWLNEGIAEYVSESWDQRKAEQLLAAKSSATLIPLKELSAALKNSSSPKVGLAYCEALSLVRFVAGRYGVYNLRRILDNIDAGDDIDGALTKAISLNAEGIEKEWLRSLE